MNRKITLLLVTLAAISLANAQGFLNNLKKTVVKDSSSAKVTGLVKTISTGSGTVLSNEEIISGLKEALNVGADNASKNLNKTDAFFGNAAIRLLMPEEAGKAESTLRSVGLGSIADKAILSMNRAAEDAAGGISSIFIDAIKKMTVTDGLKILKGGDFAATEYLKIATTATLTEKIRPVIETSLAKVNATSYWKEFFTSYNRVTFSKKPVNTDLSAYVTERSLSGIFYSIGLEEQKIRKDPAAQVTALLKKVFAK